MKKNNPNREVKYASLSDKRLRNILLAKKKERYSYRSLKEAQGVLNYIRNRFIISRLEEEEEFDPNSVELWVNGLRYMEDKSRTNGGFKGEYVRISIVEIRKKFSFQYEFILKDLKFHPQRKYIARKFANFGDPIIRDIVRGRKYKTFDHAKDELDRLFQRYPESSINGGFDRLFIQLYKKSDDNQNVKKYILKIVELGEEEFIIDYEINPYQGSKLERKKFLIYWM